MKIVDLRARTVAIPTDGKLRHSTGVHPGYFLRTILEVVTDEGLVGLGEVGGGDQRGALMKLRERVIGLDPFHLEMIKLKVLRSIYYMSNARLYAAIEMACLDIQGKAVGRPVSDLLGGAIHDEIPFIAYLFWRYDRPGGGDDERAEDMADLCEQLTEELGVSAMKLKAGVLSPEEEVRVLELCRERLGDDYRLRIDPNGVWSVPTAIRMGQRLEAVRPEYFEDPAWGLTGNAAVREQVRIPIATNMYPAKFDDLAPAIKLGAVDIVLTDVHYWEGPRGVKELAAICRTFGLGVAMHSGVEFGVELAAMLHTASTIPEMSTAGDAHYHYLVDDIIVGGKMPYIDGAIRVPTGPGLGVELDPEKMDKYERHYEKVGDYYARFHVDERRPDWVPTVAGL
ncbi:MAG TPA: glucarate dehydratase [Microbacterium sp.]|uniref:enolase C-terminal domain-like protein n=1 Tax=Microbacterium sp. UBA1612 TaxID=1946942 RepID=UPI000E91B53F|nr:enolase C-terminal domain-like protein [Microbacterium sp. UBA1612]HBS73143.1 glucarate dehydratase [Microbacterium sp.]|tara:strand:- start:4724 stop:5914 length:1191 start_codon:yes stop_codon:yes gene_type:complete